MKCNRLVDVGRRQFLRGGVLGVAGAAAATVMPAGQAQAQTARAMLDYPSTKLANLADLKVNEPLDIGYPDSDSPGVLLKLGTAVEGGAGPDDVEHAARAHRTATLDAYLARTSHPTQH